MEIVTKIKEKKIVDLGSGTGRISNSLAKLGYSNITGLDTSDVNLAKAIEADTTKTVHYEPGMMNDIPLPTESVDSLICIGRTLPHAENFSTFDGIFAEINRVLKKDGVVIFDLPNIMKGEYARNRARFVDFLTDVGVPVQDERKPSQDRKYTYSFVDSPDGLNFYNRYCPPENIVISILEKKGFSVEVIKREPISSDHPDDENIYFRAVKKTSIIERFGYDPYPQKLVLSA